MSINAQLDVAAVLDAHSNFIAHGPATFCNVYVCAFMGLRGHVIPLRTANDLFDWFSSPRAVGLGWRRSTPDEALSVANSGGDVVCVRQDSPHGHIGVVVESLPSIPKHLCVSAAGAENFVRAPIERSFGTLRPTDAFYINVPGVTS